MKTFATIAASLLFAFLYTGFAAAQDHTKPKTILEWRSELIRSLAFTSDGKQLVVSPKDNDVWVFSAETGEKLPNDIKGLRGPTNFLLTGPRPGTVYCFEKLVSRLVDTNTGKELSMSGISIDYSPSGMLSPKKNVLALAAHAGGVELLSADLQKSEVSFEPKDPPPPNPKDWRACAAAYSPDGKFVAGARPNGRLFLSVTDGFKEASQQTVSAHAGKIEALAFTHRADSCRWVSTANSNAGARLKRKSSPRIHSPPLSIAAGCSRMVRSLPSSPSPSMVS
jgi:WD40 repeat protein